MKAEARFHVGGKLNGEGMLGNLHRVWAAGVQEVPTHSALPLLCGRHHTGERECLEMKPGKKGKIAKKLPVCTEALSRDLELVSLCFLECQHALESALQSWRRLEQHLEHPDSLLYIFSPRNRCSFWGVKTYFHKIEYVYFPPMSTAATSIQRFLFNYLLFEKLLYSSYSFRYQGYEDEYDGTPCIPGAHTLGSRDGVRYKPCPNHNMQLD